MCIRAIMASTTFSSQSKGFDDKSYEALKSNVSNFIRTSSVRTATRTAPRRRLVVRATNADCDSVAVRAIPLPPKPLSDTPLPLSRRPRRNRKSPTLLTAFQETTISPANLVYPIFIHQGEGNVPIETMPGRYRLGWRHGLIEEVARARDVGVNSIMLYPKIHNALKSQTGDECYNDNGLVQQTIRLLKDKYPDLVIYTDVNLDEYTSEGHAGIVGVDGSILNDETVHQWCKQAVSHARAGADVVCPSEMMDGRVAAVRAALDAEGFQLVSIMSYAAKYTSSLYGRFRRSLNSRSRVLDKRTYQINPANYKEALIEALEDDAEGADILMVKPGLPCLDIIRLLKDKHFLPIGACQVSGEYSMIKAAGMLNIIDEEKVMMEALTCLRRAGADIILTYFALEAASCLCGEKIH